MATNEGKKAFLSLAAIAAYLVVMLNDDNTVSAHDGAATSRAIGFTEGPQVDDYCGVKLNNCAGTVELKAVTV